jgi:hypothetical protein
MEGSLKSSCTPLRSYSIGNSKTEKTSVLVGEGRGVEPHPLKKKDYEKLELRLRRLSSMIAFRTSASCSGINLPEKSKEWKILSILWGFILSHLLYPPFSGICSR